MELYNEDCLEVLKRMDSKSVDLVFTDPPYELDTHGGTKNVNLKRKLHDNHIKEISNGFDMENVFSEMLRVCKTPNLLIFCSNKQIAKTMAFFEAKKLSTTLLIWQKTNPVPFAHGKYQEEVEFIIFVRGKNAPFDNDVGIQGKKKVITCPTLSSKARVHPTQKPPQVLQTLLKLHSREGDTVVDTFMGSGSLGKVCLSLGRDFIGIEIEEKMFNIAKEYIGESDV